MQYDDTRFPQTPPRLRSLYISQPLYFVTICTEERKPCLAVPHIHEAFVQFCRHSHDIHGIATGRYVIMPDHIHFFIRLPSSKTLGNFIGLLKQKLHMAARESDFQEEHLWQRGFFDHVLRSDESYAQKWQYVFQNPARKGLVTASEDWPYAGEIVAIDRS